jgi:SAM-dependent methyltransferase
MAHSEPIVCRMMPDNCVVRRGDDRSGSDMSDDDLRAMHEYYELGLEQARLESGAGIIERERTKEIVLRHLPDLPCVVADIGGGPGQYALWLAELGCTVHHRDVVPLHVEQLKAAGTGPRVDSRVADARHLDLEDAAVDAVLLFGPLYHLPKRGDRLQALREARRIVRPGRPVFVAAITRWAARLNAVLVERFYRSMPHVLDEVERVERTGALDPLFPGSFTGYSHRPRQLTAELRAAGIEVVDLVGVEGPTAMLLDLTDRMQDPADAAVVLEAARALERVPELLGSGPHLVATGRRPAVDREGST